jgi:hypothetical protein
MGSLELELTSGQKNDACPWFDKLTIRFKPIKIAWNHIPYESFGAVVWGASFVGLSWAT